MSHRKSTVVLFLGVFLFFVSTFASDARAEISCDDAKAWADQRASDLPKTLAEISAIAMAYRREILSRSSPELKASLWTEHLQSFESRLNETQKSYLTNLKTKITPSLFSSPEPAGLPSPAELKAVFGNELATQMFSFIGPPEREDLQAIGIAKLKSKKAANRKIASAPAEGSSCTCSSLSDYCDNGMYCSESLCKHYRGCGTFWLYFCNGLCFQRH